MNKKPIVILDPGHGGHDPGAVNRSYPLEEAAMALDVCVRAKRMLDEYADCRLTRSTDVFLTLSERPAIANDANADAFVSYHFNSASSPNTALSYEGYTTKGQNRSDQLCSAILDAHGKLFPEQKLRADDQDGDPDKEANFAVIRKTDCASCLIEGEFIHTTHGAALIADPSNREAMALAVFQGVMRFLDLTTHAEDRPDPTPPAESLSSRIAAIEWQLSKIKADLAL